jgi:hypothetical protein
LIGLGTKQVKFDMPGDGFDSWNYLDIARSFFKKYKYDGSTEQDKELFFVAKKIISIVEQEYEKNRLDLPGVWEWTTLRSGKKWPLSKWVQINTVAPYKKATSLIKKHSNSHT